ncbi:MAG: response regulator [Polyangia bacterium]
MKPFVLVVDDSLTVRMDLRQVLGNANFAVTACGTLTTARQVLHTRGCDLAIVDLLLPDGNGADLLREMRADPELRHIPVILISSMAQQAPPEDVAIDPELGADGYIGKPFDPQRVVRLAEEVCTANLGGKRFLLVDDSPTFSYALASILRQQGNTVLCVDTGEQALELLDSEPFDCVILDMVMPGIGGIETCRRLRQLRTGKDLPVVMLTANENTSGRSQGVAVGADEFLLKSHRVEKMIQQIRSLLRRKQKSRTSSPSLTPIAGPGVAPSPAANLPELILTATGLTKSVARMVLTRACRSIGLDPAQVTASVLPRLISSLRDNLALFLSPQQLSERLDAIRALGEQPGPRSAPPPSTGPGPRSAPPSSTVSGVRSAPSPSAISATRAGSR